MAFNVAGVDENGKIFPEVLPDEGLAEKVTTDGPVKDALKSTIEREAQPLIDAAVADPGVEFVTVPELMSRDWYHR